MKSLNNTDLPDLVQQIREEAAELQEKPRFMEVCGTHTVAIFRNGIHSLLEGCVELVSGPGCPVCVTPDQQIDTAIAYARQGHVLASFGDMLRVPGTLSSLLAERAAGAAVQVVTSPLEVLTIAKDQPDKQVLFFAVGFETTTPGTALLLERARAEKVENIKLIMAHKVIPPAMETLLNDARQRISGFLCPGHVASIIGVAPFEKISLKYQIPSVVAGFEGRDILLAVRMLIRQIKEGRIEAENQYRRGVKPEGNPRALQLMAKYFETADSAWRGFDNIGRSGLNLRPEYRNWDALYSIPVEMVTSQPVKGCCCGQVLQGIITPRQCQLFGNACTPQTPVGPCMVSGEGACLAHYRYGE
ncbi:MAG TPA: hydrogenase formation protein HypD [Bacillota bacterium]|nr:hydrogenase formation protein HypD [Bacillota bacterium]